MPKKLKPIQAVPFDLPCLGRTLVVSVALIATNDSAWCQFQVDTSSYNRPPPPSALDTLHQVQQLELQRQQIEMQRLQIEQQRLQMDQAQQRQLDFERQQAELYRKRQAARAKQNKN